MEVRIFCKKMHFRLVNSKKVRTFAPAFEKQGQS